MVKILHRYKSVRMALWRCRQRYELCMLLPKPTRAGYVAYGYTWIP